MTAADHELILTRTFEVSRERLWAAWTQADQLAKWWGPKGFALEVAKLDFKPGGVFHYLMKANGHEMWGKFVYREVVAPERIVFINSFSNPEGGVTRHPMSPKWPLEVLNTQTFEEADGKTTMTLRGAPFNASEAETKTFEDGRSSMQQGFKGTLDQLEAFLAKR
jgi:uncharacterized protein YndB with AHSA1/START domain